jgi:hypothetical protein
LVSWDCGVSIPVAVTTMGSRLAVASVAGLLAETIGASAAASGMKSPGVCAESGVKAKIVQRRGNAKMSWDFFNGSLLSPLGEHWKVPASIRSPDFRSPYSPRLPIKLGTWQWHPCGFRPDHSRGAVEVFHFLPLDQCSSGW